MAVDMTGRVCLVTGASSGIGKECCVELAKMGATVVGVGRNPQRSDEALAEIRKRSGSKAVEMLLGDFARLDDVRKVAQQFKDRHARLHVLVNNAGTVYPERQLTEQGIDLTFAVNHLSYFLLTRELLPLLQASPPARVVNVASKANYRGKIDLDDLGHARGWSVEAAYSRSKLANVLFTKELARRLEGTAVTANCLHPGVVATDIWGRAWQSRLLGWLIRLTMITPEQGAKTMVYLATDPGVQQTTGLYFDECKPKRPNRLADDAELARALWQKSAELVGAS